MGVEFQPDRNAEAIPERCGQQARPRGRRHQGERRQIDADGARRGPLADHQIQHMVLHGGIEDFFHIGGQPVDLIDEQHVARFKVGQDRRQISGLGQHRPGGGAKVDPQLPGHDLGQRGLAQAGRPEQQHVIQRLTAVLRRLDEDAEVTLGLLLADELGHGLRPERLVGRFEGGGFARDQPGHRPNSCRAALISAGASTSSPRRMAAPSTTRRAAGSATPSPSRAATASPTAVGFGGVCTAA